jgi:hypothetical protein
MSDYFPGSDDGQKEWLINFIAKLATYGPVVGITAPVQAQLSSLGNAAKAGIENLGAKKILYDAAVANRTELRDDFLEVARPVIRAAKHSPGYSETIGRELGIAAQDTPVDPAAIKPVVRLAVQGTCVRVRIQRKGAESANVYVRLLGQTQWTFLSASNRATYDDKRPLAQAGVAEIREYMVMGVIGNTEVGMPSDAKTVVFAGELAA